MLGGEDFYDEVRRAMAAIVLELVRIANDDNVRLNDRGTFLILLVEIDVKGSGVKLAGLSFEIGTQPGDKADRNLLVDSGRGG